MPAFRISIIHSYLTSKSTNSIPTCFAEARAVFAEAILQKIAKIWHGGSSRKQIFRGRIRGSCGCVRRSYAKGFAEVRPYVQQSKKEFLTPLMCCLVVCCMWFLRIESYSNCMAKLLFDVGNLNYTPDCLALFLPVVLLHICCFCFAMFDGIVWL